MPRKRSTQSWCISCGEDPMDLVYEKIDGLIRICRFKTEADAKKEASTFVAKGYTPVLVANAKLKVEETERNKINQTAHAKKVAAAERRAARKARAFLASKKS